MFKRSLDITLAGFMLVVTLPLMALAAIIIKLESEGPVIFRQVRVGRNFKRFKLLKLRTMRSSGEGSSFTLGDDPRITRFGRWLRWLKFDELPQLWNVFRGEMSLVGPRPVVPELAEEFNAAYRRLLQVRPGLTDPATVKYCRESEILAHVPEPLEYFKKVLIPEKLRISQAYLQRANMWSDIGLMIRTAFVLLPSAWQPHLRKPASVESRTAPMAFFPEVVRRRRVQPMIDSVLIAGSVEQLASAEGSTGRRAQVASNQLAYRHFRHESTHREWGREQFRP